MSLSGVLRVQGQKDDTADKGREEQQTRCPDEGSAENQRETTQNPRDHRSAEKQCPLAHAASLTGAAGAVIVDEPYRLSSVDEIRVNGTTAYTTADATPARKASMPIGFETGKAARDGTTGSLCESTVRSLNDTVCAKRMCSDGTL